MSNLPQISVQELAEKMLIGESIQLVDVREVQELSIASLPGFKHLPLSTSESWSVNIHRHLDKELETLVLCHHGIRSAQMCQWLIGQGFKDVKNVSGGINAYSVQIDPGISQY